MTTPIETIKNWFRTGLKPTQAQFWAWIDSFWHKDTPIPQDSIEGLTNVLNEKLDISKVTSNLESNNMVEVFSTAAIRQLQDHRISVDGFDFTWHKIPSNTGNQPITGEVLSGGYTNQGKTFVKFMIRLGNGDASTISGYRIKETL